jgi:hypothetical protein
MQVTGAFVADTSAAATLSIAAPNGNKMPASP